MSCNISTVNNNNFKYNFIYNWFEKYKSYINCRIVKTYTVHNDHSIKIILYCKNEMCVYKNLSGILLETNCIIIDVKKSGFRQFEVILGFPMLDISI
jgi:hypothetical protein